MACIYKIINNINQKMYIGKTNGTIQSRWQDHKSNCKKISKNKRPLYNAMNFYGIENFSVEQIEECSLDFACEREIYWISFYNTYHGEGYNATQGGDGKHYADYDLITKEYLELGTIKKVIEKTGYDRDTIRIALKNNGIRIISSEEHAKNNSAKKVIMFDLQGNFIKSWESIGDAAKFIISENFLDLLKNLNGVKGHISDCAKGKRKTAYKYKWEFIE